MPISRQSFKPSDISKQTLSPFRSSKPLVATVVSLIIIDRIWDVGISVPLEISVFVTEEIILRIPSVGAS